MQFTYNAIHPGEYNSVVFLYIHRIVQPSPLSILEHFHDLMKKSHIL